MVVLISVNVETKANSLSFSVSVSDIQCTFNSESARSGKALMGIKDSISARLRKPDGFKGHPLFADDRGIDPMTDPVCQIRPDATDITKLTYSLHVSDFSKCGVLKRNVSDTLPLAMYRP